MDKNAIKKYAVWARRELITRVSLRSEFYGITENNFGDPNADSVNGRLLTEPEKKERRALIAQLDKKGYQEVMEEVAYTWFNRFIALRFMEVNGYLPSHVRVFTDDENAFKPQILTEAINLDLDGLDLEKVYALKNANDDDELFKYLLIVQCNALGAILPGMFEKISDYTELLFPDNLLRRGSVVEQMISLIPEEDWRDQVQIIGWLYQYYNSEKKDEVFAALKKNVKITRENIPAATQLFTPDWIVRYMVENSLGRLWVEGHPDEALKANWKYYLEEAQQEPQVQAQLAEIRREYAQLKPEDIKVIDPCCGSGHILAYLFDVLVQIYEAYGYTTREAVASILRDNLYGLDIDDRAAQLSYFAVMMKGRQYDRRFFNRKDADGNPDVPQPHVYAICESGSTDEKGRLHRNYDEHVLSYFCDGDPQLTAAMETILKELFEAKEYGSILTVTNQNWDALYNRFDALFDEGGMEAGLAWKELLPLVQLAEVLAQKYDVVVTNPPYMGSDSLGNKLKEYIGKNYNDARYDMYAAFILKCLDMKSSKGFSALITQNSFLYALCFDRLRAQLLGKTSIVNAVHLGPHAFEEISGEVVQTIATIFMSKISDFKSKFIRLVEKVEDKEGGFFREQPYVVDCSFFSLLPNSVFAYSISPVMKLLCLDMPKIGDSFLSKAGVVTGKDEYFLRYWHEVDFGVFDLNATDITSRYVPFSKGGSFAKWYGNIVYALRLSDLWNDEKVNKSVRRGDRTAYFKECVGWSSMGGGNDKNFSILNQCVCGTGTPTILSSNSEMLNYVLGFLNTKIPPKFIALFNPTLNTYASDICNLPFIETPDKMSVISTVEESKTKAKEDWDSYETSWDFKRNPLL